MDEKLDLTALKKDDLKDPQRDGLHNTKYVCPACLHHALSVHNDSGIYKCLHCGITGQTYEAREADREKKMLAGGSTTGSPVRKGSGRKFAASSGPQAKEEAVPTIIEDYVSLSDEQLACIEDVSDAPAVGGAQLTVRNYLLSQGITVEAARQMHLGVADHLFTTKNKEEETSSSLPCLVYRNYVEGVCCNAKYRAVNTISVKKFIRGTQVEIRKLNKLFTQESSFTPCAPYGIDCLRPAEGEELVPIGKHLIITEGEKDCVILRMLGYPYVISAANGAQTNHAESFEAFQPWLARVERVIICGDQDKPGRRMTASLIAYLDDKKVWVAKWDQRRLGKDIGEVYQRHGAEQVHALLRGSELVERADLEEYISQETRQQVLDKLKGLFDHGYSLGVDTLMDRHFMLSDQGGLIIATGTPGTGKTDFLNFLTTRLMVVRDASVCYCSFETADKLRHASEIASIWMGDPRPDLLTEDQTRPFAETAMDHVTHIILDHDRPTVARILRKAEISMRRHPDTQFLVIDPYLYLNLTEGSRISETDAIRNMLTELRAWALMHRVWVFIVAHPRKLNKEDGSTEWEKIDYYSISGSANWANVADFVLSVNRVRRETPSVDYTEVNVLKVRDQKICVPGSMFFIRHPSGRYFICESEETAQMRKCHPVLDPYPVSLSAI